MSDPGFLPARASSVAAGVDSVFLFIFWLSAFFLALIVALTVWFVVRYRARPGRMEAEPSPSHNMKLELIWTGIPLALVFVIFIASTRVYGRMVGPVTYGPTLQIQVNARKWSWWFDHPGGKGSNELHLVQGKPVELVMSSADVVHSLYVPQFRLKQDVVPGRFTKMSFVPVLAGEFAIECAEYCGTNHSLMSAKVVVHPDQQSWDRWSEEGNQVVASLAEIGKQVHAMRGCIACHSTDGTRRVGPSFQGIWHSQEHLADGTSVTVDDDYVRESILKPAAKVVAGYPPAMPPTPLEEREIQGVIAYLKTLRKDTP